VRVGVWGVWGVRVRGGARRISSCWEVERGKRGRGGRPGIGVC